jgi:hypothetical protein
MAERSISQPTKFYPVGVSIPAGAFAMRFLTLIASDEYAAKRQFSAMFIVLK